MKHMPSLYLFFLCSFSYSQNYHISKTVIDNNTTEPIEYAEVFNSESNSATNNYGSFIFSSTKNEVNIRKLGYENLQFKFNDFKENDTIYMNPKVFLLDEVVISDCKPLMKKVYEKIEKNYLLKPYTDRFFLRCIVSKNGKIIRFQDISGKIQRETMFMTPATPKNKYTIEVLNMRKAGIKVKSNDIEDIKMHSVEVLFNWHTTIFTNLDQYNYTIEKNIDGDNCKIHFDKNDTNTSKMYGTGYYVVNKKNFAIMEFANKNIFENIDEMPFSKQRNFKWRTTNTELSVNFKMNDEIKKNSINSAILKQSLEVIKDDTIKNTYDFAYEIITTNSFIKDKVNSNFSADKDIFKAKFPYSKDFWKNQNQLPLTEELEQFLKSVAEKKDKTKEYEVIGNF